MAKKKTDKGDDAKDEAKQGKGKTIGLAVAFAVIGAVVGPKVMGGGSASAEASATTTTTTVAGPVVVLDAVTLNLSDGRLLQVGVRSEEPTSQRQALMAHPNAVFVSQYKRAY